MSPTRWMPSRPKTKAALQRHMKQRLMQRAGLDLNKAERREIDRKIQCGEAEFVARSSGIRTLWRVLAQGKTLNVVYDSKRHTVCTVLPDCAIEFKEAVDGPQVERNKTQVQA